jgi:HEPN domain-containing protein
VGWSDEWRFRDCPWCGLRDAELRMLAGPDLEAKASKGVRWWAVVVCPRCAGAVLIEHNNPEYAHPEKMQVVPSLGQRVEIRALPEEVQANYEQAIRALDTGLSDLAAVALRRALEAACQQVLNEKDRQQRNLYEQIQLLVDQRLVTKEFAKALDHLRKIGNVGAHPQSFKEVISVHVSQQDAERALRVATQVFRSLFEIPAELAKL